MPSKTAAFPQVESRSQNDFSKPIVYKDDHDASDMDANVPEKLDTLGVSI